MVKDYWRARGVAHPGDRCFTCGLLVRLKTFALLEDYLREGAWHLYEVEQLFSSSFCLRTFASFEDYWRAGVWRLQEATRLQPDYFDAYNDLWGAIALLEDY